MEDRDFVDEKIESLKNNSIKLFVIAEEYFIEDYYVENSPIFIVDTEKLAKEIVTDLNSFSEKLENEKDIFYTFRNKWYDDNPVELEERIPITKWKAGIRMDEITKEMRTKRTLIMKRNERIDEENGKLQNEHERLMYEAFDDFAKDKNMVFNVTQIETTHTRKFIYYPINKINGVLK